MTDTRPHGSDKEDSYRPDGIPRFDLRATVVTYSRRPDRCTVYPHDVDRDARLSAWLSADQDAFVDLSEVR